MRTESITERRRRSRHYDHSATFELRVNRTPSDITILAADVDTSDSGMCVITVDRLEKGNIVNVRKSLSTGGISAEVVWVREYYPDLYKVGLMFLVSGQRPLPI